MTKYEQFIEVLQQNTKFMERISVGIEAINHSNELHKKAIEVNTNATNEMAIQMKAMLSLFKWIMIALVLAIIVLAGVEKFYKFLPFFKL